MAIIKCKMCGGDLNIVEGESVCECEYCGTRQTIPSADNEKKLTLFARANRLRLASEFDKAFGIYESIVADFPEEAEAYWGLVLCKYGIEYVDDPANGKKIPTCHRSSFESVLKDSDFEQACENADGTARRVYREEAKQIEEIRKGILEVSGKEKPYDIFICYKETDENGDRTLDSVLAQDIYDALTDKGYRVFFSRITLEDKLGQEYEPYIFAALNSAKIMLAVGTDYEYYNAVWVKNEWSRYLKIMAKDKDKHLIPCYKNLDAYDMPEEFAKLQAQDLGKVGAIQDLLRGVEKLLGGAQETKSEQTVVVKAEAPGVESLLKRADMFLADREWDNAKEYYNRVLDIDPECADAYLGLSLADCQCVSIEQAVEQKNQDFFDSKDLEKADRFADDALKSKIAEVNRLIASMGGSRRQKIARLQYIRQKLKPFTDRIISAGRNQIVGLRSDGTVAVTGDNEAGQNGECEVSEWEDIVAVSAGNGYTVGLHSDGTVVATKYTGKTYFDQCDVSSWRDIVAISAGGYYTAGLRSDGTVVATGAQKTMVSKWSNIVAISVGGNHTVGLRDDGTVVATKCYGDPRTYSGQCEVSDWTDIVAVSAGEDYTVGLRSDGTVVATKYTGQRYYGQCEVSDWSDIVAISAGLGLSSCTVGLRSDGTVVVTKFKEGFDFGERNVSDWKDIVAVCTGGHRTVGLCSDGTVVAVGNTHKGQCNVSDWTDIISTSIGYDNTVGLCSDGTVTAVGKNEKGQCEVSDWRDITSISVGENHTVGLHKSGTVVAVGDNEKGQCEVSDWTDIVAISTGGQHTVGLHSDGTVVAAGNNEAGQCDISDWKDIVAISSSYAQTIGLCHNGTVVAAGYNQAGQCNVSDWKDIAAISASGGHTVGLHSDGTVVAVGNNQTGQCNVSDWKDIVAIRAGDEYTVGLRSNGTVIATNYTGDPRSYDGQCDVSAWKDIAVITVGGNYTVGVHTDGTAVAVGYNRYGQCNVSDWNNVVSVEAKGDHAVGLRRDGTVVASGGGTNVSNWKLFGSLETIEQEQKAAHEQFLVREEIRKEEERKAEERRKEEKRKAEERRKEEERKAEERRKEEERKAEQRRREEERKRMERITLENQRRSQGLCPYCGGTFKGLFKKVCTQCGTSKDY